MWYFLGYGVWSFGVVQASGNYAGQVQEHSAGSGNTSCRELGSEPSSKDSEPLLT